MDLGRRRQLGRQVDLAGGRGAEVAHRFHVTLVLAGVIGVVTGLAVAGFESVVAPTLEWVLDRPPAVVAVVPALGLIAANLIGMWHGGGDTATTDAYVRAYHQRGGRLGIGAMLRKVGGSAMTLGSGNALGFEGPSMLIGGTIGSTVEERFATRIRRDDAKVLMVAGAAAGVAAVFKAPLTGVIFALEVPYRSDMARRALLPTLVAAGAAYVTYVAFIGTEPLLPTGGSAPFDLRDLGGGLVLGLLCGGLARVGALAMGQAKRLPLGRLVRLALAVATLVALTPLAQLWFDGPYHLGPSYDAIEWATAADRSVLVLCGLFALRALTTWLAVAAGGMGGLFIPLVTQGAIVGAIFQGVVEAPNSRLFPTIGIAAFLGAGYRTPLAGVAFVAEATGQPGFLVPALLAAATAQLTMGRSSFSPFQRSERLPDVAPLAAMPVADLMWANAETVNAAKTVDEAALEMARQNRRWAPVVDGSTYVGLIAVADIAKIARSQWPAVTVRQIVRAGLPPALPDDPVSVVAAQLRASDSDAIVVTDRGGRVVGVVTRRDLDNVEMLLDRLADESS